MKIFLTKSLEVFRISNAELMFKMVLPFMLGAMIILVLWTTFDIFDKVAYDKDDYPLMDVSTVEITCASNTAFGPAACAIYLALLLIVGCVIAYRTRGVSKRNYKEAESTAWISYNSLLVLIITTMLQIILSSNTPNVLVRDSVLFFAIWFVCIANAFLLFLPKIWRLHVRKRTTVDSGSSNRRRNDSDDSTPHFGQSEIGQSDI